MPHLPQNLAVGWYSAPQAAQVATSGAPQSMQNLFPALASASQLGHIMSFLGIAVRIITLEGRCEWMQDHFSP